MSETRKYPFYFGFHPKQIEGEPECSWIIKHQPQDGDLHVIEFDLDFIPEHFGKLVQEYKDDKSGKKPIDKTRRQELSYILQCLVLRVYITPRSPHIIPPTHPMLIDGKNYMVTPGKSKIPRICTYQASGDLFIPANNQLQSYGAVFCKVEEIISK